MPLFPFLPQGPEPESIATYQSDCVTPLTNFTVGNTVCAKAEGPIIGFQTIYWVDSQGGLVQLDTISANSPSATRLVDVSGNWKVYLASGNDGSLRARSAFGVSDPVTPTVDLSVFHDSRSDFSAGGNVLYRVIALNQGPSAASTVELSVAVPNNATYVSSSQDSGASFDCTPGAASTICTIPSLAPNEFGSFTFIYQINGGTATGTEISSTASILAAPRRSCMHRTTLRRHRLMSWVAVVAVTVAAQRAPSIARIISPQRLTLRMTAPPREPPVRM